MIKFSDDDKKTVELIINKYKESLASCSDYKELAEIGYEFTELVTWGLGNVNIRTWKEYAAIVFYDPEITKTIPFEQQKKLSNKYSPKYIRILQRIYFIRNLIASQLVVINSNSLLFTLFEIKDDELALRFPLKEVSMSNFIKEYHEARILPTSELQELFNNNFKDEEQIRYEKQIRIANRGLKKANYSIWISLLGLIIAVIVPFIINACTTNTINNEQIIEMKHSIETNQKEISNRLDKLVKTTEYSNNNIKSQN